MTLSWVMSALVADRGWDSRRASTAPIRLGDSMGGSDAAAGMSLSCCMCGSVSAWELWWVASKGGEREGDERLGPWRPNAIRVSNRHLVSVPDAWGCRLRRTSEWGWLCGLANGADERLGHVRTIDGRNDRAPWRYVVLTRRLP